MPKASSITKMQVANAVAELSQRGVLVTTRSIRGYLGSGSHTTITNFLREIQNDKDASLSPEQRLTDLPDRLISLIHATWLALEKSVMETAEAERRKTKDLENRLRERWSSLVKEKFRALRNLQEEKTSRAKLEEVLRDANNQIYKQHAIILDLKVSQIRVETLNEQLCQRVSELELAYAAAKKNLDFLAEQTAYQRQVENEKYLHKLSKLEQDLRLSREQLMKLSLKLAGNN